MIDLFIESDSLKLLRNNIAIECCRQNDWNARVFFEIYIILICDKLVNKTTIKLSECNIMWYTVWMWFTITVII